MLSFLRYALCSLPEGLGLSQEDSLALPAP